MSSDQVETVLMATVAHLGRPMTGECDDDDESFITNLAELVWDQPETVDDALTHLATRPTDGMFVVPAAEILRKVKERVSQIPERPARLNPPGVREDDPELAEALAVLAGCDDPEEAMFALARILDLGHEKPVVEALAGYREERPLLLRRLRQTIGDLLEDDPQDRSAITLLRLVETARAR